MNRYTFDAVRAALRAHWGLALYRGSHARADGPRDGRFDPYHSTTGFIVDGQLPRRGYGSQRFRSLVDVVEHWDLGKVLAKGRPR
jgi:hypothetical protein